MTQERHGSFVPEWTLGERLAKARKVTGLNTTDFADLIGVSQKTVNNAENDKHGVRKIVLNAWAMATGVSLEWLATGEGSSHPGPTGPGGGKPTPELEALTRAKRDRSRTTSGRRTTAGYLPAVA